jgi:hypothetical protein
MAPVSEVILVSPQYVVAAKVGIAQDREPHLPTQPPLYCEDFIQAE